MQEKSPLEGKNVLAVDDEQDILTTLEELLPMCNLFLASTFEEARDLLGTQPFDLAILDIMGVDGYRLLELAVSRNIPAVMLTAHAFAPEHLMRSIKKGAVSYLPKEELPNIEIFLGDVLKAQDEGLNPWASWRERLPSSYFEKRWGAAWQDTDKDFWDRFRASLKERTAKESKDND
jgi:CheY-like chemotaxis protein